MAGEVHKELPTPRLHHQDEGELRRNARITHHLYPVTLAPYNMQQSVTLAPYNTQQSVTLAPYNMQQSPWIPTPSYAGPLQHAAIAMDTNTQSRWPPTTSSNRHGYQHPVTLAPYNTQQSPWIPTPSYAGPLQHAAIAMDTNTQLRWPPTTRSNRHGYQHPVTLAPLQQAASKKVSKSFISSIIYIHYI